MIYKNKIMAVLFFLLILLVLVTQNLSWKKMDKELTVIKISYEDCKPQKQVCNVELGGIKLGILFDEDVFYLKPFNVSVLLDDNSSNKVESVYIDFKMKNMDMGINRFLLSITDTKNKKQSWQGKALVPICVTGRADWFSEVEVITNKVKYILTFPLFVKQATN